MIPLALLSGAATVGLLASPYPMLALLPGPLTVGGVLLARHPVVALYAIVFMIPYGAFRKFGEVNLPWILGGLLIAVLVLQVMMQKSVPRQIQWPLWPAMLAYVGVNAVAAQLAPFQATAEHELFLLIAAQVFILTAMAFLTPEGFRHTLPRVIVWSVSLGSLLGIIGYLTGLGAFAEDVPQGALMRSVGGATDPNNQSVMILFALPLMVHLALYAESRRERLVMVALAFANVVNLTFTMSRSGFVAGIVTGLVILFHYRYLLTPRRLGVMMVGALAAVAVLVAVVPASFIERQQSLLEWEDRSLSRRTSYLNVAWDAFKENPVIGSGPGTFIDYYARSDVTRLFSSHPERWRRRAHNTYLEILVGSGLVGFALFATVLVGAVRQLWRAERAFKVQGDWKTGDLTACYRIGFVVLLAFLVTFSEMYHKYMLLSLALSQVALYLSGATAHAAPGRPWSGRAPAGRSAATETSSP